jgi:predicted CoA-binding protein
MADPTTDDDLRNLLTKSRTIAIVGASSSPSKPSHGIMKILLEAGYTVIPVNPSETNVLGAPAVASLDAVGAPVDIVDVFRRAEQTPEIADAAVRIGAKALWLQAGIVSEEAAARAHAGGLAVVMDRCIGETVSRLGVTVDRRRDPERGSGIGDRGAGKVIGDR